MKHPRWWPFAAGLLVGMPLGAALIVRLGPNTGYYGSQELKLTVHNLRDFDESGSPQLREYLKGRVYDLVAAGVSSKWVNDEIDFGPVDRKILGSAAVVKGAESDDELYRMALEKAEGRARKIAVSSGNRPE